MSLFYAKKHPFLFVSFPLLNPAGFIMFVLSDSQSLAFMLVVSVKVAGRGNIFRVVSYPGGQEGMAWFSLFDFVTSDFVPILSSLLLRIRTKALSL